MSQFQMYALASVVLFCMSLYGFIDHRHLLRKILAVNIMASSIFLLLVSVSFRNYRAIPDPVPHAMVLTGIVVAVSVTAFALALARRFYDETGASALPEEEDAA
jgi:multicomponent Na+:H+ antiporter subunit C